MNVIKQLKPPIIALFSIILALVLHYFLPIAKIISTPYNWIGIVIVGLGLLVNLWAALMFRKKNTTIHPHKEPSAVITEGPYRFTRNPIYVGGIILLLGISIFLGTVSAFVAPIAFYLAINRIFIPHEEKKMERIFGQEYLKYKHSVRRWI